ncbi:MAG: hypothetical protein NT084_04580, partial [Bacteroidetes bacterium]|nr:hypothetical protein [Bacteroidota bacterium]
MKQTGIKFAALGVLLVVSLFLSNIIYSKWFYKDDLIETDAKMLLDLDSLQNVNDIIYFAESSNATTGYYDTCKKSISELIADQLKNKSLGTIQHAAIHAKTYLELIKNIRQFYGEDAELCYNYGKIINEKQFNRIINYLQ